MELNEANGSTASARWRWPAVRWKSSLYTKYEVKRGLRDINGKGVLAGLTQIGEVQAHPEGDATGPGHLIYRGMDIEDIVAGFLPEGRPGFEETCFCC